MSILVSNHTFPLICSDGESGIEARAMLEDAEVNLKELEERLKRVQPMINLVDNMVKLGSLYNTNGPADSHMTGNGNYVYLPN